MYQTAASDLFGTEIAPTIHYLTWHQPFASLMLHGKKETRDKPTNVRGPVLILSSQTPFANSVIFNMCGPKIMANIIDVLKEEPTAGITEHAIAIGNLVDCKPMSAKDEKQCFVKYMPGKWMWIFEDVQRIEPLEMKGKQGWGIIKDMKLLQQIIPII